MPLTDQLRDIWEACSEGLLGRGEVERPWRHLLGQLVCLGSHTITKLLCTSGRTQQDWTADYRLYSRQRLDTDAIFSRLRDQLLTELPADAPLVVAMDDSLLRRCGRHVHGVAYRRDPTSPPFQANLVLGQRILQLAATLPLGGGMTRAVPIGFRHAPTPLRPPRQADATAQAAYAEAKRESTMGTLGAGEVLRLRTQLPAERPLHIVVDGRFTVGTLLKRLPANTTLIGRVRKDAKLYYPPLEQPGRGRRRDYGELAPTPEQLRTDDTIAYQSITLRHQGEALTFRVKTLAPLKWRPAGAERLLRLLVIAPVCYRRNATGKQLYRQPGYLICTDPDLPLEQILREYLQRWDIEVNFRDQKTLLGLGQAQVRTVPSNQHVPAFAVAAYGMLLLASARLARENPDFIAIRPPAWQRSPASRPTTAKLINHLRCECFANMAEQEHFCGFSFTPPSTMKPQKFPIDPHAAIAYATSG